VVSSDKLRRLLQVASDKLPLPRRVVSVGLLQRLVSSVRLLHLLLVVLVHLLLVVLVHLLLVVLVHLLLVGLVHLLLEDSVHQLRLAVNLIIVRRYSAYIKKRTLPS